MSSPQSEVARLREQIEKEYQASQLALAGPAWVGRHAFLTKKQENIGEHFESLADVLGSKQEAMKVIVEVMAGLPEGGDTGLP